MATSTLPGVFSKDSHHGPLLISIPLPLLKDLVAEELSFPSTVSIGEWIVMSKIVNQDSVGLTEYIYTSLSMVRKLFGYISDPWFDAPVPGNSSSLLC